MNEATTELRTGVDPDGEAYVGIVDWRDRPRARARGGMLGAETLRASRVPVTLPTPPWANED